MSFMGDVKIQLSLTSACLSLSQTAITEGLEQSHLFVLHNIQNSIDTVLQYYNIT